MEPIRKLLVAVDNGARSATVVMAAARLGQQLNADIALVSVVDVNGLMTVGGVTLRELADEMHQELAKAQQALVHELFPDRTIPCFLEEGPITDEVLRVADEWGADMIVLGTHGRTGLAHIFMGSVAEHIVRHSKKPLLVVPIEA